MNLKICIWLCFPGSILNLRTGDTILNFKSPRTFFHIRLKYFPSLLRDCLEHLDSKETQELPEISVEMEHQGLWERKVSQDLREFG